MDTNGPVSTIDHRQIAGAIHNRNFDNSVSHVELQHLYPPYSRPSRKLRTAHLQQTWI